MQKNTETEMLIITNTDTIIIVGIFFIATKIKKNIPKPYYEASEYYIFFNNKNTIYTNIIYAFSTL